MKNADFTKILNKEHEEKWVALTKDHDQVIGYDSRLADLRKSVGEENDEVVYLRVPRSDIDYAF